MKYDLTVFLGDDREPENYEMSFDELPEVGQIVTLRDGLKVEVVGIAGDLEEDGFINLHTVEVLK